MAKVQGINQVLATLRKKQEEGKQDDGASIIVGFTARYAVYVHENLEQKLKGKPRPSGLGTYWGPNGQPKFLEAPARELSGELADIIYRVYSKGVRLIKALFTAGLRLQREAMLRVPVEYSFLKNSAFTREEK